MSDILGFINQIDKVAEGFANPENLLTILQKFILVKVP